MGAFLKIFQGVDEKIRVYNDTAVLYLKNPTTVLTFSQVDTDEVTGQKWLTFNINEENFMEAGIAQYQLFEGNLLKEYGSAQIIPSLKVNVNQDLRSKYAIIIEAIEKQLAGIATKAQREITIGDKKVAHYSADDLLRLLDYFKGKLKEQQDGYDTVNNEMKVLYKWTLR